jgi:SPP1 gp7 family putative phage head morphogenesis protein
VTIDEQIAAVERDRKRRENGLSLLLLALADKSRAFVNKAVRIGAGWSNVLRAVLLGDEQLDQPGGVPVLAGIMADTHHAGVSRVGRILGVPVAPRLAIDDLATVYRPRAYDALERIRGTLDDAIVERLREAVEVDKISADVRAVGEAFTAKGWAPGNRYGADFTATAVVTRAYAAGMQEAFAEPDVAAVMTGLRFVNPLDEVTTDICRVRAGVILPLDSPWWFRSYPPLHAGCRSVALPTTGNVKFTENPPEFPAPEPGWGSYAGIL